MDNKRKLILKVWTFIYLIQDIGSNNSQKQTNETICVTALFMFQC